MTARATAWSKELDGSRIGACFAAAALGAALVFYAVAKAGEYYDAMVYQYSDELVSGHTVKHLAAAAALFMVYLILRRRHA